jgi:hypothetical protein
VRLIKINKTHLFITIILLLTLLGCGSGGSSSSVSGGLGSELGGSESSSPSSGSSTYSSITLSWYKPTLNSDGSNLNDLAGYKIYYGTSSNNYTQSIDVGNITSAVISSLSPGTWCFATTAYDTAGNESGYSNEACKAIS